MPSKLVKLPPTAISQPSADAIKNSIFKGVFPENAKVTSVSHVDKQSNDKNKVSNFRLVGVINIFSKINEFAIKISLIQF